jgi:plastocyanin
LERNVGKKDKKRKRDMKRKKNTKPAAVAALAGILVAALVFFWWRIDPPYSIRGDSVTIDATEFSFTPSKLLAAPGKITFSVINKGGFPHVLLIQGPGVRMKTPLIKPGQMQSLQVRFERPGEYRLICPLRGHAERGMVGSLQVQL